MNAPNPGSDEAIDQGCTCPVIKNNFGELEEGKEFVYEEGCPVHSD